MNIVLRVRSAPTIRLRYIPGLKGDTGDVTPEAIAARDAAQAAATSAAGSATSAASSATAAGGSATSAANSATSAAGSATAASGSATSAAASAQTAANLIGGTVTQAVRWDVAQSLTSPQQAQARNNIAISATNTPSTPAGNIAATNVQAALNELDSEKADASATTSALAGKQPLSATLTSLAGVTTTAFGRARLGDADAATARTALGAQASLGFTPVQQGGGTGQSNSKIYVGWGTGGGLKAQVDTTDLGIVWTDYSAPRSHAAIGYQTLPSGLIVQWGALDVTLNSAGDAAVTFPAAFGSACYSCVVSSGFDVYATGRPIGLRESATTTGFVISVRANPGVGTARINFMAIGK